MSKRVHVKFLTDKIENEYCALAEDDRIKKKINWVIARLKQRPNCGQPIAKRLIPQEYTNHGITNAFWIELNKGARLIYSLSSENEEEIIAIIIEWFSRHKDYERRFGY